MSSTNTALLAKEVAAAGWDSVSTCWIPDDIPEIRFRGAMWMAHDRLRPALASPVHVTGRAWHGDAHVFIEGPDGSCLGKLTGQVPLAVGRVNPWIYVSGHLLTAGSVQDGLEVRRILDAAVPGDMDELAVTRTTRMLVSRAGVHGTAYHALQLLVSLMRCHEGTLPAAAAAAAHQAKLMRAVKRSVQPPRRRGWIQDMATLVCVICELAPTGNIDTVRAIDAITRTRPATRAGAPPLSETLRDRCAAARAVARAGVGPHSGLTRLK